MLSRHAVFVTLKQTAKRLRVQAVRRAMTQAAAQTATKLLYFEDTYLVQKSGACVLSVERCVRCNLGSQMWLSACLLSSLRIITRRVGCQLYQSSHGGVTVTACITCKLRLIICKLKLLVHKLPVSEQKLCRRRENGGRVE